MVQGTLDRTISSLLLTVKRICRILFYKKRSWEETQKRLDNLVQQYEKDWKIS